MSDNLPATSETFFLDLPQDAPILELDPKRRAFVVEYMGNGYKSEAAAQAVGFTRGKGKWLLQEPIVQDAVQHLQSIERHEVQISKTAIIEKYKDLLDKATEKDDLVALNRGLEGLSKVMGYNAPVKTETTVTGKVEHIHSDDLEEKLLKKMRELESYQEGSITVQPKPVEQIEESS
jgi:phage terminase small subunit